MSSDSKRSNRTPVSTILTPLERSRVDAAAQGLCDALHRESLDEILSDLRQQKANLVLISVTRYGSQNSSRVAAMVREFPRVPTVALLTETQSSTPHVTLALGQLGIRTLVDARMPAGWQTLRNIRGLLAFYRAVVRTITESFDRAPARTPPQYSSEYSDEPFLPC